MRNILLALTLTLTVAGCAGLQQKLEIATGVYKTVTETTVPASAVIPTANAFNILKAGATNYGRYCIQQDMVPSICSASNRRIVVKAVRAGTKARKQLVASIEQNQPALSSVSNVLVAAVQDLQKSPATTSFAEATR